MHIRDWNPAEGMAAQGDVLLIPVPKSVKLDLSNEIAPINNRLILQESDTSGHHHAIALCDRLEAVNLQVERLLSDAAASRISLPSAKLYRDPGAAAQMRSISILTRTDLVVGLLIVETGAMTLTHEDHDGIRIPPGTYLVSRQIESAGAEERVVRD